MHDEFATRWLGIGPAIVLMILAVAPAGAAGSAGDREVGPGQAAPTTHGLTVVWGGFASTQLVNPETPAAFWSLTLDFPVIAAWGVDARVGVDNAVFGDPSEGFSALIQPARSGYQLGLGTARLPSHLRLWYFHVSDHNVDEIAARVNNDFDWTIGPGGLSDMLVLEAPVGAFVLGGGPAYVSRHTNTIPRLLGLDGVMLTAVESRGAIGYARREFAWLGMRGRLGGLVLLNAQDENRVFMATDEEDAIPILVKFSRSQTAVGGSMTKTFEDLGLVGTALWGTFDVSISIGVRWHFGLTR